MRSKYFGGFLGAFAVALLLGLMLSPTLSQAANHIRPVGKTTLQTSQLVLWYDQDIDDQDRRFSDIQVTNASVDTPVWVHVQVFASSCTNFQNEFCAPADVVLCAETDFNDFYTPNDTHIYYLNDPFRNDPATFDGENPTSFIASFDGTKGFIVVTPIDGPGTRNAIAHQHMLGTSYVFDTDFESAYIVNSMGRDAVSFSTGNVVADGTVLDGSASGYVLLQPDILKFNFNRDFYFAADIISIAFRDNYEGVFGYVAEPADATWTPLIFDEDENPISCSPVPQNCFFNIGINNEMPPINDLLNPVEDTSLCPGNNNEIGFVKVAVGGLTGLENELGLATFTGEGGFDINRGVARWMHTE